MRARQRRHESNGKRLRRERQLELAGRLALHLGIDDPEQWLELQPDRVIAYWEAFDQRRPIGFEWEQYANLMAMLEVLVAATTSPNLEEKDRIKPRGSDAFLPPGLQEKKKKKGMLHKQLQLLARVFGGSYGNDNQ